MPQPGPGYYEGSQGEGGAATGQEGVHFAPFQPDAEDHLRSFKVLPEERQQMEEDYRMALAMQKGEAAVAAGGGGGGGGADVGGKSEEERKLVTLRVLRLFFFVSRVFHNSRYNFHV